MNKEIIEITPHKSLWGKIGKNKYTIPNAISELIDNCIDSKLKDKPLNISIAFQIGGNEIIVKDNGSGMNKADLSSALKIAYSNKSIDAIGEYGFGLKSATSYLGKSLKLFTKHRDSQDILLFNYEESSFLSTDDWIVEVEYLNKSEARDLIDPMLSYYNISQEFNHGTLIVIRNLNINLYPSLSYDDDFRGILIPKLMRQYKSFLEKDIKIQLYIKRASGRDLPVIDISPMKRINLALKIDISFSIKCPSKSSKLVNGWVGLLPLSLEINEKTNKNINKNSGFIVTKKNKVILENEYIGYKFHPETRLITGELELDDFEVLNSKNDFVRNTEWQSLELALCTLFIPVLKTMSNSRFINNLRTECILNKIKPRLGSYFNDLYKNNYLHVLKTKDLEKLNILFDSLSFRVDESIKFKLSANETLIHNISPLKEELHADNFELSQDIVPHRVLVDNKPIMEQRYNFSILYDNTLVITHKLIDLDDDILYKWDISEKIDKEILYVFTNTLHPRLNNYKNSIEYICITNIQNSLSEYLNKNLNNKLEMSPELLYNINQCIIQKLDKSYIRKEDQNE